MSDASDAAEPAAPADGAFAAPTRRRAVVAGASVATAVALAIGIVSLGGGESDAVATIDTAAVTAAATLPSVSITAPTTTPTTTVAATTTTTVAPTTTLPRQQSQPIAPPADPRSTEDAPHIGSIAIPKIGLESAMHSGIRLTTLDQGPGHWPGTAMPGEVGNVVVAAHRTSHNAEFRDIDALDPGDEVVFATDTGEHTYVVTGTQIVGPEAIWITNPTETPTATLFACHPLGSTAQRIVVNLELSR